MSEQQRAQDVEDSANGKGCWQASGHEPTPLIDEFYDDKEVFDNWFGDSVTDHDSLTAACIKAKLVVIRGHKRTLDARARRGDWESHAESLQRLAHYQRDFGKFMFDLINNYMEEASERCK